MSYVRPNGAATSFALVGYTAPGGSGIQARFSFGATAFILLDDAYTAPLGSDADFTEAAGYTAPTGNAINAQFAGSYTRPAGSAVNFSFLTSADAVIDFNVDVTFDVAAEFENVAVDGSINFTVEVTAEAEAAHGISGTAAFTIDVDATAEGVHGISGTAEFSIDVTVTAVAEHPRYVLKGEVRDGGVLVNRTVRAYRRSDGAFIGEQVTDSGRFDIHAGFAAAEHYLLPIDLDSGAVDYTPPAVNRVLSVLAVD